MTAWANIHRRGTGRYRQCGGKVRYRTLRQARWSAAERRRVSGEATIAPCILAGSRPGDIVLDPFFGSGTTGRVAIRHGRACWGIELNPDYVEQSLDRTNGVQLEAQL